MPIAINSAGIIMPLMALLFLVDKVLVMADPFPIILNCRERSLAHFPARPLGCYSLLNMPSEPPLVLHEPPLEVDLLVIVGGVSRLIFVCI